MQKSKKISLITIFFVISALSAIPVNEKNRCELLVTRSPLTSTVFYEDTTGVAHDVYVSGNYAYIADHDAGLAIVDISDPTNPGTPVYEVLTSDARSVYVSGNYAYVACTSSGLAIVNISDPTNPEIITYEDTDGSSWGIYVSGGFAYIAEYFGGLAIINVSDPTNPGTPVYEDTASLPSAIYVSGGFAYVADSDGLAIINVSDPINPSTVGYENTTGYAVDVFVRGGLAYVADYNGLAIINVSDPINPSTVGYENTTGHAYGVDVSGDFAYMGNYLSGLAVINVSDSTNPGTPVYTNTTGKAKGVFVSGDYVYIADHESGLAVISIIDSTDPVIIVTPSNLIVEYGYTGQSFSWTATDANPGNYTIELVGTGIVATSAPWTNNTPIVYNIPDGLNVGSHTYTITFKDNYSNFITDSVSFTVEDTTNPILTSTPSDLTIEFGYSGQSISWTATDANPSTYKIELQGTGVVTGPTAWTSGLVITYNIPNDFAVGTYVYTVNFTDDYGNSVIDSVLLTVEEAVADTPGGGIPFGNMFLIFIGISVLYLILTRRRQIVNEFR